MRVFITGATGLIGRRLVADRLRRGDEVVVLTRNPEKAKVYFAPDVNPRVEIIAGDPGRFGSWPSAIKHCDAVVNLAGAGIADKRWSKAYKHTLVHSRVNGTHNIVLAIRDAEPRSRVLVNASAIGYYGETGEEFRDESAPPGDDFLADLCVQWETQALEARSDTTRVVCLRIGVVLDPRGGALGRMLTPFKFFAGGPIGNGRQFMSWIHWRDLMGLFNLALTRDDCDGPLNGVSPQSVTNREFARSLGRVLGRPSWLPAPKFALRLALGEFAPFVSMSQRISPDVARKLGYDFIHEPLDEALRSALSDETS